MVDARSASFKGPSMELAINKSGLIWGHDMTRYLGCKTRNFPVAVNDKIGTNRDAKGRIARPFQTTHSKCPNIRLQSLLANIALQPQEPSSVSAKHIALLVLGQKWCGTSSYC